MTSHPSQHATVGISARISPRLRDELNTTVAAIKDQGERMSVRQALEEAIAAWCADADRRFHLTKSEEV